MCKMYLTRMTTPPIIKFFKDLDKHDTPLVGGKGANLGEMTKAGFPVPNGFAITINAYDSFLAENDIAKKIYDRQGNFYEVGKAHD